MKNIVILNAYGEKNIGDAAILLSTLNFINSIGTYKISILCENTDIKNRYGILKNFLLLQLPYGYAISSDGKPASPFLKIVRFCKVQTFSYFYYFSHKFFPSLFIPSGFYSWISVISKADLVIGIGGGYLISKKTTDYFGLLLTTLTLKMAQKLKKEILYFPLSFGPFASKHHEAISFEAIKNTTMMCREDITLKKVQTLDKNTHAVKAFYVPDIAFFYNWPSQTYREDKVNSDYIVLTAREWLDDEKQKKYEQDLVLLIRHLWQTRRLKTKFVSMAFNPDEDDDNRVYSRLKQFLPRIAFSRADVFTPDEVQKVLRHAKFAICTRMHSAILSATIYTPFISIGYGIKAKGVMEKLDMLNWYVDIDSVNYEILKKKVELLNKEENYEGIISNLQNKRKEFNTYKKYVTNTLKEKLIN